MKYEVSAVFNAPAATPSLSPDVPFEAADTPNDLTETPNEPEVAIIEQHDRPEKPEDASWKLADGANESAVRPSLSPDVPLEPADWLNESADWPGKTAD